MTEAISDSFALVGRQMRHIRRMPEQLIGITVMPVAFVIVFGYLFGSAMQVPGDGGYKEYIMAGIFAQVMLANITTTAVGVVGDLNNGLVDRFRALPISRSSVLVGRTVADGMLVAWTCAVMALVGYLIGWRAHNGVLQTLAGFGLLLLMGFAMSWLGALLGLVLRNAETVSAVSGVIMMPLAFLSNAFVPLDGLPGWMRAVAEWNPVSAVVSASRDLFGNERGPASGAFPSEHPVPAALGVLVLLIVVVVPLAGRAYQKAAAQR
ncbi:ABC transporter permease [Streptomyces sp. NPDC087866]|uniref:ABC transporter permease n=1 Tax=unclassified Streptomyces TaxID=2593676 RepID=UPI0011CE0D4F|nr:MULTISPECIES: ABC transporter permease [unclassified Streptomyces]MCX4446053.1 ABC transporter permease [Streptomyces sp. NBC_01789]TXS06440.1 ABC transporter permease [Streptomyces sp. col6]